MGLGPLLLSILGGLVRLALAPVVAWLLKEGILTPDQTVELYAGITGGLVLVGWVIWNKYKDRLMLLTGLALPEGATEEMLKAIVKAKLTPAVTTPQTEAPVLPDPK
jgi:hypothetical protein